MKTFLKYKYGQVNQVCNQIRLLLCTFMDIPIDINALDTPPLNTTSTSSNQS